MERGNEIEVPKYNIRPFLMQNTEGRQPMSEQVMFLNFNKISSMRILILQKDLGLIIKIIFGESRSKSLNI